MKISNLLMIVIIFGQSNLVLARCDAYNLPLNPRASESNNIPEHGAIPGQPFLNGGSIWKTENYDGTIFDVRGVTGCHILNPVGLHQAFATPLGTRIHNLVYQENGKEFSVFETGTPGIGYAIAVRDYNSGIEIPLRNYTVRTVDSSTHLPTIGYRARLIFIVTSNSLPSGVYHIPRQNIVRLWSLGIWDDGRDAPEHSYIVLNATTLTVKAQGCIYNSPEKQHVKMPTISRDFQNHQAEKYQSEFSVSISCDPNVTVYATMTDVNHPNSTDSILRGSPSSTAKGIGLQIYKFDDINPISFGPDSAIKGNINQWYLGGDKQTARTTYTIPFRAQYFKLTNEENLTPGTFHAEASITFSYQ